VPIPLKIALFVDGSPGHEKQTRGIVKALQEQHPVDTKEICIKHLPFVQDVLSWFKYLLGLDIAQSAFRDHFDLVIGAGTHTHIPMLVYKRHTGVMTCTCMAPSPLLRKNFDICFVPQHDGIKERGNIFLTVGPPNCSVAEMNHDTQKALILIGGTDPKSHHWDSFEIGAFVKELISREISKDWIISSSPRTPAETISLIEKIASQFYNVSFFKYQDTESGWVERQYNRNKTVWVTADSMSMVYEALSAGCHVGILPVVWKKKNNKFKRSEKYLLDRGLVVSFASWREGNLSWRQGKPLAEAQRCADEILRVWHLKN